MSELRAVLDVLAQHRVHWVTVAIVLGFVVIRKFVPWLAERFTIADRETMNLVQAVMHENADLRREVARLRREARAIRREQMEANNGP